MKYEILEHTADFKIRVFGKDKKALFENAMVGMFEGGEYEKEGKEIKRKIEISSFDLSSLLVDFLSEVLYLAEVKQEVYFKVDFKKFSEKEIKGTLVGKGLKSIRVQIKGVTYHDLDVHQREDGTWAATILFDI